MPVSLSRRQTLGGAGLFMATAASAQAAGTSATLRIVRPKANQLENPTGIHDQSIRLSWQLQTATRNTAQAAYRIRAASTAEALNTGQADIWDSDRVESDHSFDVPYGGPPLLSRQRVWWQVQVWDTHGRTAVSAPAFWEMGLLSPADWRAQWLAIENTERRADRETGLFWVTAPEKPDSQTAQFRLPFVLEQAAQLTILSVADTNYRLFADGQAVSLPPWQRIAFGKPGTVETFMSLDRGAHVVALSVDVSRTGPLRCAFMLRLTYPDGRVERLNALAARVSGDAPEGWHQTGFQAEAWPTVVRVEGLSQPLPGSGAYLVRRNFRTVDTVISARLFVTALGAYEVCLNGRRVGEDILAPESMDFRKRTRYRVHDVTPLLHKGQNCIGAIIGDGWYGSRTAPLGRFAFGDAPLRFIAQLELTYADGRSEIIGTDETWKLSAAPITSSEIYNGEHYDARLEQPGWDRADFTETDNWSPVRILPPETGTTPLEGAISPPIRRIKTLAPVSVTPLGDGACVVDFGQNFAGWARIRVTGTRGQKVTLKFAEVLKADGHVDQANLREAKCTDTYILRGDADAEIWEPRFTYHGFRYVEVSGLGAPLTKADITGIVLHSDLRETGQLKLGNALLQQFWHNSYWSQRSNFMGIPTDCPQRDERLGWLGDAHVFWDAAAFNMDVGAFTRRWMEDIRDAQYANGAFAFIAPNSMPYTAPNEASPGWADAGVILPWTAWKRYGDTAVIDQNWDAMAGYIAYIEAHSDDYIWARGHGWDFGDWLALDAKNPGDPTTPKDLIGTAMFKQSVDALTDMARATGRIEAVEKYSALSRNIRDAFIRTYVTADATIGNDSQTSYILALAHDLVPEPLKPAAAEKLRANIVRRGNLLSTGFLGTPASLDVLADNGFGTTVYDLLLRTDFPSWGYMVMKGATTTWERWNSDVGDVTMNSFNHYAFGAVIGFLYRRIAGIDPIEAGFRRFRVNPIQDARLNTGGADYEAVVGRISTRWARQGKTFTLDLTVPANSQAQVHLPTTDIRRVSENGQTVNGRTEFAVMTAPDGTVILTAGSGHYRFAVTT